jgi:hypothetical protein
VNKRREIWDCIFGGISNVFKHIKRTGLCRGHPPPIDRLELGIRCLVHYYLKFLLTWMGVGGCGWMWCFLKWVLMEWYGWTGADALFTQRDVGSDGSKWIWIHPFLD